MRKHFTYDFINNKIIGSKAAITRANRGMNPEYTELTEMLTEHPTFKVIEKVITNKKNKQTYSSLTLKRMEEYISLQKDSKKKLIEFKAVVTVAEAKGSKYPLTKKWFLATYKEYKNSVISETETEKTINEEMKAAS